MLSYMIYCSKSRRKPAWAANIRLYKQPHNQEAFCRRSWLLALERLTWLLRRRVDGFEVLGEDQRLMLIAGGIAPDRINLKRDASPVIVHGDEQPQQRADRGDQNEPFSRAKPSIVPRGRWN